MPNRILVQPKGYDRGTTLPTPTYIVIELNSSKPISRLAEMASRLARKFGATKVHVAPTGLGGPLADELVSLAGSDFTVISDYNLKIEVQSTQM